MRTTLVLIAFFVLGFFCQLTHAISSACTSNPCLGGGTCAVGSQDHHWYCICPQDKTGTRCEKGIHDCSSQPCRNGGSCCESHNAYSCACKPGFTGDRCETDIDECLSNPCQNGGTCVDQANGYNCTCRVGLVGRQCEAKKPGCQSNTCLNGGSCTESNDGMWYCICPKAYQGIQCQERINDCSNHPCKNGGSCCDRGDHYVCTCSSAFYGKHCEKKCNCKNGGRCRNIHHGCSCPSPYSGSLCETHYCDMRESCYNGGTCLKIPNGFACLCSRGYTGNWCQREIISPSKTQTVFPSSKCFCQNGGRCGISHDDCTCPYPYTGRYCETHYCDIQTPCHNGGTCVKIPNGFTCFCLRKYTGDQCQQEASGSASSTCTCINPGTCFYKGDTPVCYCKNPYIGKFCEVMTTPTPSSSSRPASSSVRPTPSVILIHDHICDIMRPCGPNGKCIKTPQGFNCQCIHGFTGRRCENHQIISPSSPQTVMASSSKFICNCQNGARCQVFGNNLEYCVCSSPYTGRNCETHYCELGSTCGNRGTCVKIPNGFTCFCAWPFTGRHCQQTASSTTTPTCTCLNGGSCYFKAETPFCVCPDLYTGKICEAAISTSSPQTVSASSSTAISTSSPQTVSSSSSMCSCLPGRGRCGSGTCLCMLGYYGPRCEFEHNYCTIQNFCHGLRCVKLGPDYYTCVTSTPTVTPFSLTVLPSTTSSQVTQNTYTSSTSRSSTSGKTTLKWTGHPHTTIVTTPSTSLHSTSGHPHTTVITTPSSYLTSVSLKTTIVTTPSSSSHSTSALSIPIKRRSKREVVKETKMSDKEDKELKTICKQSELKAKKIFGENPFNKENWNALHPAIKAVLVDLVANNDHKRLSSTHAQIKKAVAGNNLMKMSRIMAERSLWKRVPAARYWKRKVMMKKAVKTPLESLVQSDEFC